MFPIEEFQSTLLKFKRILDEHAIGFHLTGGIVSITYAEPRMTQDVDIVIDNESTRASLKAFLQSLADSEFLYHEPTIRRAVDDGGMFQLIDRNESLKLDIYPRELIAGELSRSVEAEIFAGVFLPIVSLPDAVASKLVWVSKGSHKSRRDIQLMMLTCDLEAQAAIRATAASLSLESLLIEILNESDDIV